MNTVETNLNERESLIMEILYALGNATAADLESFSRGLLNNVPVSMFLDTLEKKGLLTVARTDGLSVYSPVHMPEAAPVKVTTIERVLNAIRSVPQTLTGLGKISDISDAEINKLTAPIRSGSKICIR